MRECVDAPHPQSLAARHLNVCRCRDIIAMVAREGDFVRVPSRGCSVAVLAVLLLLLLLLLFLLLFLLLLLLLLFLLTVMGVTRVRSLGKNVEALCTGTRRGGVERRRRGHVASEPTLHLGRHVFGWYGLCVVMVLYGLYLCRAYCLPESRQRSGRPTWRAKEEAAPQGAKEEEREKKK